MDTMKLKIGPRAPYIMCYPEYRALIDHCYDRFTKFRNPCKSCVYRARSSEKAKGCMFITCPRDWSNT